MTTPLDNIERLRADLERALAERDQYREDFENAHEMCDADLEAQKRDTRNARTGEVIATVMAVLFAAAAIVLALN